MAERREKVSPIRDQLDAAVQDVGADPPERSDDNGLPGDCPVTPLGTAGGIYYYIDALYQLRVLLAREHTRLNMLSLFGKEIEWLYDHFVITAKNNNRKIDTGLLEETLFKACSIAGLWDPIAKVRGAGGWLGGDGGLVFHCGDKILAGGEWFDPGDMGGFVYPAEPPTPRPGPRLPGAAPGVALLELFRTWNWRRPELDPHLLLGWVGAAMLGAAIKWRPMVWVTGAKASGKSTLLIDVIQNVIVHILAVADTTAAGIWQRAMHSPIPIAIDEAEAEADDRKMQAVIKLARQAASGAVMLRGGDAHKGMQFQARSCFMFGSILVPPLLGQDHSRMAILELDALPEGAEAPEIIPDHLAGLGAGLRRQLVDQWDRWPKTLKAYQEMLVSVGHGGRGADQFGTLLAVADLLTAQAEPGAEDLAFWSEHLAAGVLAERSEELGDDEECLDHLLTTTIDPWKSGKRKTIAEWIEEVMGDSKQHDNCNRALGTYGLRVMYGMADGPASEWALCVANTHQGLEQLFRDTRWKGGVWMQSLRRIPGHEKDLQRIGGTSRRCTRVPVTRAIKGEAATATAGASASSSKSPNPKS